MQTNPAFCRKTPPAQKRRRRYGLDGDAASALLAAAERSRNAPGSAAWVAPFTFFTQKPAKHTRAQTVWDSLTVGACTVRKPKALTACSYETVPLA